MHEIKTLTISADAFIASKSDQWKLDRVVTVKSTDGESVRSYEREKWVFHKSNESFVLCMERLRGIDDGHAELRCGYWIVGRNGTMKGRWTWGRYAPIMPLGDYETMHRIARDEGLFV